MVKNVIYYDILRVRAKQRNLYQSKKQSEWVLILIDKKLEVCMYIPKNSPKVHKVVRDDRDAEESRKRLLKVIWIWT